MLRKAFIVLFITMAWFLPSFAKESVPVERPATFVELWNNFAFYDTHFEQKKFAALLGRYEGKVGLNVFNLPLQIYGVYYGVTSQDNHYWNNSLYSGGGVRLKPFENYQSRTWLLSWLTGTKIFAENLTAGYLKGADSAEADGLKKNDTRYGIEVWQEWNLDDPNEKLPWGELWASIAFRSTNFSTMESGRVVYNFQPKLGWHLGGGIETYLRADIVYSDASDYWLNVADYGVGLRFEPWRKIGDTNDFFRKFKMFAEILGGDYLKDRPQDPNKEVFSDVRFGVDFSYGR